MTDKLSGFGVKIIARCICPMGEYFCFLFYYVFVFLYIYSYWHIVWLFVRSSVLPIRFVILYSNADILIFHIFVCMCWFYCMKMVAYAAAYDTDTGVCDHPPWARVANKDKSKQNAYNFQIIYFIHSSQGFFFFSSIIIIKLQ